MRNKIKIIFILITCFVLSNSIYCKKDWDKINLERAEKAIKNHKYIDAYIKMKQISADYEQDKHKELMKIIQKNLYNELEKEIYSFKKGLSDNINTYKNHIELLNNIDNNYSNYDKAQELKAKIPDISYEIALDLYNKKEYNTAKYFFKLVTSDSAKYQESINLLNKIDDIKKFEDKIDELKNSMIVVCSSSSFVNIAGWKDFDAINKDRRYIVNGGWIDNRLKMVESGELIWFPCGTKVIASNTKGKYTEVKHNDRYAWILTKDLKKDTAAEKEAIRLENERSQHINENQFEEDNFEEKNTDDDVDDYDVDDDDMNFEEANIEETNIEEVDSNNKDNNTKISIDGVWMSNTGRKFEIISEDDVLSISIVETDSKYQGEWISESSFKYTSNVEYIGKIKDENTIIISEDKNKYTWTKIEMDLKKLNIIGD